ncbi:MAG: phage protease, partial [Spirochaetota bacterium]
MNHPMNQVLPLPELNALEGDYMPPTELLLVPAGEFCGRDETLYRNSNPKKIVALFKREGIALAIDFDHSIYYHGGGAACGWIPKLEVRNGEIWGTGIEWLPDALWALRNKTYKYYSPHYMVDGATREIERLDVVSLVNRPRLSVAALNHLQNQETNFSEENSMNLQDELNAALK